MFKLVEPTTEISYHVSTGQRIINVSTQDTGLYACVSCSNYGDLRTTIYGYFVDIIDQVSTSDRIIELLFDHAEGDKIDLNELAIYLKLRECQHHFDRVWDKCSSSGSDEAKEQYKMYSQSSVSIK